MTHIDEGRLQALIDGELRLDERHRAERHLAECAPCRAELEALRASGAHFGAAMVALDAAPRGRQHAIGWPRGRRQAALRGWLPRAAVLLLFVGAAASATIPGSPLRQWLGLERDTPAAPAELPVAVAEPAVVAPPPPPVESGVSVEAADGAVEIALQDAGPDLRVQARVVEGSRAGVYAIGPAASSRFQTSTGRIEVLNARSGELRIELPRDVRTAVVIVNGREYLRKQDGRLDLRVGGADETPAEIEFTVQP